VHARHKPREREVVVDGLVDDVELDVEKIPRRKVKNGFRRRKLFLELGQRGSSVFLTRVRESNITSRQSQKQKNTRA